MKKRILFISPTLPYPPINGGEIGSWDNLEYLASKFNVDVACFSDDRNINDFRDFLKEKNIQNIFDVPFKVRPRSFKNIIFSIFNNLPISIYRNKSSELYKKVEEIIKLNQYDIIYVNHWLMAQHVPKNFNGIVILKEHNAEYLIWERLSKIEKNLFKKLYMKFEVSRMKRYESYVCNKADYVNTLTENDSLALKKIGVDYNKMTVVPAIMIREQDLINKYKLPFDKRENSLLYIGLMSWEANIDGLKYFFENIYPHIKSQFNNLKMYVVGKNPPDDLLKFGQKDSSIIFTGFVENLNEYYGKCKLFVVPLRYGSGIKVKILHAMAKSIPVIGTKVGMEGITGAGILAKNDEELINKTVSLLKDNKESEELCDAAMNYLREEISEKKFNQFFEKFM